MTEISVDSIPGSDWFTEYCEESKYLVCRLCSKVLLEGHLCSKKHIRNIDYWEAKLEKAHEIARTKVLKDNLSFDDPDMAVESFEKKLCQKLEIESWDSSTSQLSSTSHQGTPWYLEYGEGGGLVCRLCGKYSEAENGHEDSVKHKNRVEFYYQEAIILTEESGCLLLTELGFKDSKRALSELNRIHNESVKKTKEPVTEKQIQTVTCQESVSEKRSQSLNWLESSLTIPEYKGNELLKVTPKLVLQEDKWEIGITSYKTSECQTLNVKSHEEFLKDISGPEVVETTRCFDYFLSLRRLFGERTNINN